MWSLLDILSLKLRHIVVTSGSESRPVRLVGIITFMPKIFYDGGLCLVSAWFTFQPSFPCKCSMLSDGTCWLTTPGGRSRWPFITGWSSVTRDRSPMFPKEPWVLWLCLSHSTSTRVCQLAYIQLQNLQRLWKIQHPVGTVQISYTAAELNHWIVQYPHKTSSFYDLWHDVHCVRFWQLLF